jgi:hypothetical protein
MLGSTVARALHLRPGVAVCALLAACSGTIEGGKSAAGPGPTGGAMAPPASGLPEVVGRDGKPCTTQTFTPARIWRLSDDQYAAAIADLIPGMTVAAISTPGRSKAEFVNFAETLPVNSALATDIRNSVEAVARQAVTDLPKLLACAPGQAQDACVDAFIDRFGSRAFRRPLEAAEKQELSALYAAGATDGQSEGVRLLVTAILQAPSFLYRTELGKGAAEGKPVELTSHEQASALSFFLLDSIPDEPLWAAAQDGSLARPEVLKTQVQRLLALPRVHQNLTRVMLKWVGLGEGISVDLADKNPQFTPELKASLEEETRLFLGNLLTSGGNLTDLLTSNRGFVDRRLATHYGVTAPVAATGFSEVTYPPGERAGIITQAGVLARYSLGTPVVLRGKFIRDQLLCGEISDPPDIPDVETETAAAARLPEREQVSRRLANPVCGACHKMMDPLGLAFTQYDNLARFRPNGADGKPIDASGTISGTEDVDGPVASAVDLAARLARSKSVRACIEEKIFSYAFGRLRESFDSCELGRIDAHVQARGGQLAELAAAVVYSAAFRTRTGGK